ncbi:MAG: phosphotransferase [Planctomycetota bacterium]
MGNIMLELDADNTLDYLRRRGDVPDLDQARVEMLGWGVSNVVLRVTRPGSDDLIIKQCRTQLRTKTEWISRLDRIFREIGMLRLLAPLLPSGVIPQVLFEDRENYLFAMEAFPADHVVWKQALLEGQLDLSIADRLGDYLSTVHAQTSFRPDLAAEWGDLEVFDQLRLDPFYRYLARVRPEVSGPIERLIQENLTTSCCIVLADFSPKNILLAGDRLALVDFETGHYGDPAFDLGFFLSHLLLKAVRDAAQFDAFAELTRRFWKHYRAGLEGVQQHAEFAESALFRRTQGHLAGCLWARVDGKSPVDYLNLETSRQQVREFSRSLFESPATTWDETLARLKAGLPAPR